MHIVHGCYGMATGRKQTHYDCPWSRLLNLASHFLARLYFKEKLHLWLHFTHGSVGPIIPPGEGGKD